MCKENVISGCLVITNTNAIPFHHILSEIPRDKLFLIARKDSFVENEITSLHPHYKIIILIDNYYNSGDVELAACEIFDKYKFNRIVAPAEDDILRAGKLRVYFGIDGQTYKSALAFRDKILMKEILKNALVKVSHFSKLRSPIDAMAFTEKFGFPVVVKPVRSLGAKDIHILEHTNELTRFLRSAEFFDSAYLNQYEIEEFIHGNMYQVDGIVKNGHIIAIWPSRFRGNCVDFLNGKIFECNLLSATDPLLPRLKEFAEKVIKTLPTPQDTAFHLEVFHTNEDMLIFCEIASRVGGPRLREVWMEGFGIDIGSLFIRMQAGLHFELSTVTTLQPKKICGFMVVPSQNGTLQSMELTCPYPWVTHYFPHKEKVGMHLSHLKQYGDTIASLVLTGNDSDEYLQHSKEITQWLKDTIHWN